MSATPDGLTPAAFAHYSFGCAVAPDGAVWFTEFNRQRLRRYDPRTGAARTVREGLPGMYGLAIAPDGALYVGQDLGDRDNPGRVLRLDPDGRNERVAVAGLTRPRQLALAPDGALWIVCEAGSALGGVAPSVLRHDPATGKTTVVAAGLRTPQGVAVGRDGGVWVSEYGVPGGAAGRLLRVVPGGAPVEVAAGFPRARGIAAGPDGRIYLVNEADDDDHGNSARLVAIAPRDGRTEVLLDGLDYPQFPAFAPGGALWFVVNRDSRLVRWRRPRAVHREPGGAAVVGGRWARRGGVRVRLSGAFGAVSGALVPDPGAAVVEGWLRVPAPVAGVSREELSTDRGDPERPQPGLFAVPEVAGSAATGRLALDALCVRARTGRRWPMRNVGTKDEAPAAGFDERPVAYLVWFGWRPGATA